MQLSISFRSTVVLIYRLVGRDPNEGDNLRLFSSSGSSPQFFKALHMQGLFFCALHMLGEPLRITNTCEQHINILVLTVQA
ncbi:hypothetical protein [Pararobbsia silviterrae]|uniref:Uncharacterized protein n=1 Tax=Pararobbsia silviterrae TaxID=1792498 RepID=A0A494Y9R9_9BURK|nr:hypothetical protein [Pararobbsia silviterrae]RKP58430.1 hypothetical protein D7S86_00215 [Pararobbsia silviterrae]